MQGPAVTKLILAKGANANSQDAGGDTPLHVATHKSVARLLLACHSNVNAKNNDGQTPLHCAASQGNKEVVAFLLANRADVNTKDADAQTPLQSALRGQERNVTGRGDYEGTIELLRHYGGTE
jgi:ankyrin repeat protein